MILKSYEIKKSILKIIKNNFFLIYGENNGLKKDIKELIKTEIKEKNPNTENLSFYEDEIIKNEEQFYNSIYSGSLFGDKKIITIIISTEKIFKIIENIFDKNPKDVYFLIIGELLDKKSKFRSFFEKNKQTLCVPCYPDSEKDLENIAINELKKNNTSLSKQIINLLIEKSNYDRNNLRNELDKIMVFGSNKKNLEFQDIKSIINFSGEYKSEILINECLCGNIMQFKKILSEIYENAINQVLVFRILNNKINRLINMKKDQEKYGNLDNLLNSSKPPIFWKEKPLVKKQLNIWKYKDLKKISYRINDIEILCKKNPQISKIVFFKFFTEICNQANNYS